MDITIYAKKVTVEHRQNGYRQPVDLEDVDKDDFDNEDVAKCVSIENFFNSHDEDDIKDYVKKHYDWFTPDDDQF